MGLLPLLGCLAAQPKPGDSPGETAVDETGDSPDTADTEKYDPYEDHDGDGFPAVAECDDTNGAVYPGAPETWNELDDDCDGYVDGEGVFTGEARLEAHAIYKGEDVRIAAWCNVGLGRDGSLVNLRWTCDAGKNDDDPDFILLLGEFLTVDGEDGIGALETTWVGDVTVTSSDGWDSEGTATLEWTSTRTVETTFVLDAAILDVTGAGTLERDEDDC